MNLKVILALSASLTAFHAMADCIGDICTGERVINGYNEISTVIAIDNMESKVVTRNSNQQLKSYNSYELSDEIQSSELPSGKSVIDEYNIIGTVNVVFRNGKIVYRRAGYSSDTIGTNVSPEVSEISGLSSGTRIIDEYNIKGEIRRMFKNGSIFYRRDGYSSDTMTNNSRNLVQKAEMAGEVSRNTEIIDEYNIKGKVTDIYADGRVFYRRSGYSSDTMTSNNRNLVLRVSSVDGLVEGTSIIDDYNIMGRVTDLYKDGRVFYRRSGYSSDTMIQGNKLVKEVSNLGERFKQGTLAIDSYNLPGRVQNLFADGRMMFRRDGYSSSNIVTDLSEEVFEHKHYSKETRYASNNNKISKPSNFFANGMILHAGSVVSELYESVEQYEGITKDSDLISILGKVSKAKEIFANGIVSLDNKNETVSRIVVYKNVKDKEQMQSHLARLLVIKAQNEKDESTDSISLLPSESAVVKDDVIKFVTKSDNWSLDKETKKKVLALLSGSTMPGESEVQDPEEYSLSVTPAELIDEVKSILDGEQKKYVFVSPAAAKAARKSIVIGFDKGLLKATCTVIVKERNVEIKNVSKKVGKKDTEECLAELKD